MAPPETPERAVENFITEIFGNTPAAESAVTVCLVKLLGLTGKRSLRPAVEERVEGIFRNYLRTSDRLCWCAPDAVLIVVATDLAGSLQLMARLREAQHQFSQAAGGALEVVWGLASSQ